MAEFDAHSFAEQAVLIGLMTREQAREAMQDADDGSLEALTRSMLRKGLLTSWQLDRLLKGDPTGFFYGGCKVLFHIAEGTFARVYRGRREPGGQSVAIKVLRKRFTTDPQAVQRFTQEAKAGMKLVHPNIVRIYDYGEQDKFYFMIMEFVEGSNLRDFLKIRHRLEPDQALPLMIGLAEGLNYALSQGVTHRDIKGTNILISTRGEAKLVDFGLATIEGDERRMAIAHGQRTVDYSALERTCGSPKGDPRSDIYFLGCVYYQMLTGVLPLPEVESHDPLAKMLKRSFGAIKPLSEHRYAPPAGLTQIIEKMMQIDLKKRYQTMEEVVADLKAYQASQVTYTEAPAPSARRSEAEPVAAASLDSGPAEYDEEFPGLFDSEAAPRKKALCVEVQEPIQEAFRKTLSGLGYRVLLVRDAERAIERFVETPPDLLVYDCDGLGKAAIPTFLAMHEKANESGQMQPALVLLGPRQHGLRHLIPNDDRLIVLTKPIKMKDVQDALTHLVPAG
jgi:tRNA A-37 threonylcarbamoyl transferase component Bud32/CheY-like chemotaxis protein